MDNKICEIAACQSQCESYIPLTLIEMLRLSAVVLVGVAVEAEQASSKMAIPHVRGVMGKQAENNLAGSEM